MTNSGKFDQATAAQVPSLKRRLPVVMEDPRDVVWFNGDSESPLSELCWTPTSSASLESGQIGEEQTAAMEDVPMARNETREEVQDDGVGGAPLSTTWGMGKVAWPGRKSRCLGQRP